MGKSTHKRREEQVRKFMNKLPTNLKNALSKFFFKRRLNKPTSKYTYLSGLRAFLKDMEKNPLEATEDDYKEFYEKLVANGMAEGTINLYMSYTKTFFSWYKPQDNPLHWWKSRGRKRRDSLKDKILSAEEVDALVKAAKSAKVKAVIAVLYEGGLRVGELCSLRIRDMEKTRYGYKIRVNGKTGERAIPLVDSATYLREWLLVHPDPSDPDAPLFCRIAAGGKIERMSEVSIWSAIRRTAKKAGIKKRVYPHMLRHTRLTDLAPKVTEQVLKSIAGWTPDSDMASAYVHLSGRDAERSLLEVYGIKEDEKESKEKIQSLKPVVCPNCGYVNPKEAKFCLMCGYPLDKGVDKESKGVKESVGGMLEAILRDPKFKKALIRKLKKLDDEEGV